MTQQVCPFQFSVASLSLFWFRFVSGSDLKFATRSVLVWFKVRIGVSWTSSENISFLLFG
ncbi:hypothetical protein HanXRQr2_Chr09g0404241 [Helianthus annuus]|uniref:Uncharacterized protein n=1 Tax=Helianthus annuus TaxID=4232 RepID=A0A251TZS5_HELAN|nr:hypothetical protein HanXRQr2_Chr09g0404241 [Helianthus annuus]KAJ0527240.1 hypothetical protein HanHA300_Chr09g0331871 [Helianthus annuus]KAJ0535909.1 hypothetical protein HanIR_Chr09g0435711 [Helianthus annuus]KAJ0543642.1 hypothetical protein HanHA89_Chr09g0352851 [Helianthus annuus]KAJ0708698.1 hypothetical protein HanLR1_Chr09g0332181 [Helianthus annuus]